MSVILTNEEIMKKFIQFVKDAKSDYITEGARVHKYTDLEDYKWYLSQQVNWYLSKHLGIAFNGYSS